MKHRYKWHEINSVEDLPEVGIYCWWTERSTGQLGRYKFSSEFVKNKEWFVKNFIAWTEVVPGPEPYNKFWARGLTSTLGKA